MHWESFYTPPENIQGDEVTITGDELRHLAKAMRKRIGDVIWTVDGEGNAYEVQLIEINRERALGRILSRQRDLGEPAAEVWLFQSVLKGDRFDWLVEKATELGVGGIVPLTSQETQVPVTPDKCRRWERLALAAMKQCGRSRRPQIAEPMSLEASLDWGSGWTARLMAEPAPLGQSLKTGCDGDNNRKIGLWVGPESGFSSEEVTLALEKGLKPITLGTRRLRAETAGLTLLTLAMNRLGELG